MATIIKVYKRLPAIGYCVPSPILLLDEVAANLTRTTMSSVAYLLLLPREECLDVVRNEQIRWYKDRWTSYVGDIFLYAKGV